MKKFLKKLQSHTFDEELSLSDTRDYLVDKLEYLDVINKDENLKNILSNTKEIEYTYNKATNLEWLKYFPNITELDCRNNNLDSSSLESLKYVPNLQILYISDNNIDDLTNLKFVPKLSNLNCSRNKIKTLPDINLILPSLTYLCCPENEIVLINISDCILLKHLDCGCNYVKELIVQNMLKLKYILCGANQLVNLHIINCKSLRLLYCNDNRLTLLDLSNCPQLEYLRCKNNKIQSFKDIHILKSSLKFFEHDTVLSFTSYQGLDMCCICLDTLDTLDTLETSSINEKKIKIITKCGHIFHESCLMIWTNDHAMNSKCPYCRQIF